MTEWLSVGVPVVISLATGVYAHIRSGARRNERKISDQAAALATHAEAVDGRLDELAGRVAVLEEKAQHAPSADSLRRIYRRIEEISKTLHEMKGGFEEMKALKRVILQEAFSRRAAE